MDVWTKKQTDLKTTCMNITSSTTIRELLFVWLMGAGFHFLFKSYRGDSTSSCNTESSFATVGDTAMMLFGMSLGEYEVKFTSMLNRSAVLIQRSSSRVSVMTRDNDVAILSAVTFRYCIETA